MICDRGLFSKLQKIKLLSLIKSFKLKSGKNFLCQKFTHIWPFQMAQRLSSYLLSGKSRKNVTLLVWFKTLCIDWEWIFKLRICSKAFAPFNSIFLFFITLVPNQISYALTLLQYPTECFKIYSHLVITVHYKSIKKV